MQSQEDLKLIFQSCEGAENLDADKVVFSHSDTFMGVILTYEYGEAKSLDVVIRHDRFCQASPISREEMASAIDELSRILQK